MRNVLLLCLLATLAAQADNPEVEPTLRNVQYGPHEMNVLNFWQAESDTPTPVFIHIHGGGWLAGQKQEVTHLHPYLSRGISYVSIDYRLAPEHLVPIPLLDAARAVQFVRSKAAEWNLDKTRVAVGGNSAGACTSLWLALHDDLADPASADPVARESTKPLCASVTGGQTFIDARLVIEKVGRPALNHKMIWGTVGGKSPQDALDNYEQYEALYREYSPMFHMDATDPPVFLRYSMKELDEGIHSGRFGLVLLEKSREVGATCYVVAPTAPETPYRGNSDFVLKMLLGDDAK